MRALDRPGRGPRRAASRRRPRPAAADVPHGAVAARDRPGRPAARPRRARADRRRAGDRRRHAGGSAAAQPRGDRGRGGVGRGRGRARGTVERDLSGRGDAHLREGTVRIVAGWQRWEHLAGHHDELTDIAQPGRAVRRAGVRARPGRRGRRGPAAAAPEQPVRPRARPAPGAGHGRELDDRARPPAPRPGPRRRRSRGWRPTATSPRTSTSTACSARRTDRRAAVLEHLRDRLFDASRRNPLLHFRPTGADHQPHRGVGAAGARRAAHPARRSCSRGAGRRPRGWWTARPVDVGSLVRWDDAPYAAAALDALISSARRDRAEYGRDQLRLVVAFLRWHDVKNDPGTPIDSPLVLAPVTLTKQRGVRDAYRLQLTGTQAEVNPVLRHQLDELFGLRLPETIDLASDGAVEELRASIEKQARATQPAVVVGLVDKPRIELVRHRAQVALQAYRRRRPSTRPLFGRRQYAYSYTRPGWNPLGVQIFQDRIAAPADPAVGRARRRARPAARGRDVLGADAGRRQPVHVGRRPDAWSRWPTSTTARSAWSATTTPCWPSRCRTRRSTSCSRPPRGTSPSTARPSPWPTGTSSSPPTPRSWARWRWPAPATTSSSRGRPARASRRRSPTWSPTSSRTASACCSSARSARRSTSCTRGCGRRGSARSARWCTTARRTRRSSCTGCATPTSAGWPTTSRWTPSRPAGPR